MTSLRNPRARFFTFLFPILLLVIFASVFGHGTTTADGVTVKLSRFYVPGILTMSIITAAYGTLVVSVATARETGVLKRRRATPVPPAVLVAGQALSMLVVAMITGTLLLLIAKLGYHVGIAPARWPRWPLRRSWGRLPSPAWVTPFPVWWGRSTPRNRSFRQR